MKSIDEQIDAMAAFWPGFRVVDRASRTARWEGELAADKRRFTVSISYRVPAVIEVWTILGVQPRVQVLSPELELHEDYEEGPLPHVYWNRDDLKRSFLCLFRPDIPQWTPEDLLANTTVHWASEWLYFYEGWLVTKKWFGGGWHPPALPGPKSI